MNEGQFQAYKAAAVVLALMVTTLVQTLAPYRGNWRSVLANCKVNLPLAGINVLVMGLLCNGCACAVANAAEAKRFGLTNLVQVPLWARIAFTILALDFVAYGWHRVNHKVRLMWRFHSVHHSDQIFDGTTAVRFHPGELLISLGVRLLVVGLLGIPTVGILAFEMVYAFFNFFEHGNIRLPTMVDRNLATMLITPALHRKHHSQRREQLNTNFGTIFSIWDQILGTYSASNSEETIKVGLPEATVIHGLFGLLRMPFRALESR